jgi:hypothetical protein
MSRLIANDDLITAESIAVQVETYLKMRATADHPWQTAP